MIMDAKPKYPMDFVRGRSGAPLLGALLLSYLPTSSRRDEPRRQISGEVLTYLIKSGRGAVLMVTALRWYEVVHTLSLT